MVTHIVGKVNAGLAASSSILPLGSPVGWLPSDRDQLQTRCSTSSMGYLYLYPSSKYYIGVQ